MSTQSESQGLQIGARPIPRPFTMPWGNGQVVEEVSVVSPWHEPTIQLLEFEDGAQALRFCYYHGSRFGRGPMVLGVEWLAQFAEALQSIPRIRALLKQMLDED